MNLLPNLQPHLVPAAEPATLVWPDPLANLPEPALSSGQRTCLLAEAHQWLKQGIAQYRQGQYTPALAILQQALQAYRSLGHHSGEGKVLLTLASLYYQLADYLWSMDYARQSLAVARRISDRHLSQQALSYLGNSYRHLGELQKALEAMAQSLAAARELGDSAAEMRSLNNLALIYRLQGHTAQAAQLYDASLSLAISLGELWVQAQVLQNLGNTYLAQGNPRRAIDCYDRLLRLGARSTPAAQPLPATDRRLRLRVLRNLISACLSIEDYGRAVGYLHTCLGEVRQLGDSRSEAEILANLASSYQAMGDSSLALDYLEQQLQVLLLRNDNALPKAAFETFCQRCRQSGQLKRLAPYLRLSPSLDGTVSG
jgi:tetratricopeptide (TPR) repeat protein